MWLMLRRMVLMYFGAKLLAIAARRWPRLAIAQRLLDTRHRR
jgi:hypothetical protein